MTEIQLIPNVAVFIATAQKINALQQRLDAAALTMLLDWHDSETRAPASDGETRIVDAIRERRS